MKEIDEVANLNNIEEINESKDFSSNQQANLNNEEQVDLFNTNYKTDNLTEDDINVKNKETNITKEDTNVTKQESYNEKSKDESLHVTDKLSYVSTNNSKSITIDSNMVSNYNDFRAKISNNVNRLVDDSQSNFKTLKKNDIFRNGFGRIEKGYYEIGQSLAKSADILNNYYDDLNKMQKEMAEVINGINIPSNFSINDVIIHNDNNGIALSNNNGSSLKSNETVKQELDFNYQIEKENLIDINNNVTQKVQYDDSSKIEKEIIKEISGNVSEETQYDDSSKIEKENLKEISGNVSEEVQYDDSSQIEKENQKDVKNDNAVLNSEDLDEVIDESFDKGENQ